MLIRYCQCIVSIFFIQSILHGSKLICQSKISKSSTLHHSAKSNKTSHEQQAIGTSLFQLKNYFIQRMDAQLGSYSGMKNFSKFSTRFRNIAQRLLTAIDNFPRQKQNALKVSKSSQSFGKQRIIKV